MSTVVKPKLSGMRVQPSQAVIAARHVIPAEGDEVEHLAEGDRHHGEIDAAQANDQRADNARRRACRPARRSEGPGSCSAPDSGWSAGAIGAEPEIGGVAERQNAGIAEQKIQRHRGKAEHHDAARPARYSRRRTAARYGAANSSAHDQRRSRRFLLSRSRSLEPALLAQAARADAPARPQPSSHTSPLRWPRARTRW